jgi:hypothetical protein
MMLLTAHVRFGISGQALLLQGSETGREEMRMIWMLIVVSLMFVVLCPRSLFDRWSSVSAKQQPTTFDASARDSDGVFFFPSACNQTKKEDGVQRRHRDLISPVNDSRVHHKSLSMSFCNLSFFSLPFGRGICVEGVFFFC